MSALEQVIAEHSFARGLSEKHLESLVESAMRIDFKAGELIFREGDIANRFYLILEGKVALEAPVEEHAPVVVQTIGPGDVLGWSWLFPPYYWQFDARALEPTKAIFFYGTWLRERCEQDPDLGYELLKRMAEVAMRRLQATRRQLVEASRPRSKVFS